MTSPPSPVVVSVVAICLQPPLISEAFSGRSRTAVIIRLLLSLLSPPEVDLLNLLVFADELSLLSTTAARLFCECGLIMNEELLNAVII